MDIFIVSDIGGTQMRVAAIDVVTFKMIKHKRITTQGDNEKPTDRLIQLILDVSENHSIKAIAIAVPGLLDPEKGIIFNANNIPGWINFPLREKIIDRLHVPVFLGNDANLAALGEWKFGAGIGHKDILYLTISTGIGGGVIINNRLLLGHQGLAAEFGHITLQPDGPMCVCGHKGHLEAFSSGPAIQKYVVDQLSQSVNSSLSAVKNPGARDIFLAAQNGDKLSIQAYERAGKYLGLALSNFLQILNPSIVIFGGGVSKVGDLLINPMRKTLENSIISPEYLFNLEIKTAKLGDDVGLMGALALVQSKYDHNNPEPFP
jgi:glucokinase